MADYLSYWLPSTVANEIGRPINHAASEQFRKVDPGDTIWFASILDHRLHLIGRLVVERVVSQSEAQTELGRDDVWKARYHVLSKPGTIVVARRLDVSRLTTELRFDGKIDRFPARVTGQSLQTMRRLTETSAVLLDRALKSGQEEGKRA